MRVYLDNCCYNRPFDDQTQLKVLLESLAKLAIQQKMREGELEYVWSTVLDFEIGKSKFIDRPHDADTSMGKWRGNKSVCR